MFGNHLITQLIDITEVRKGTIGEQRINSIAINGRNGEIFQSKTVGTKSIEIEFFMKYEYLPTELDGSMTMSEFEKVVRSLAYYFTSYTEPQPLYFSDAPDVYYMAICDSIDIERVLYYGTGTATFICHDPHSYSISPKMYTANQNGVITIENRGTAPTYPLISTVLNSPATYLTLIGSGDSVVQIGDPNNAFLEAEPTNPVIHQDLMTNASKWYKGSSSLLWADRVINENTSLISQGNVLRLNDYNTGGEEGSGNYTGAFYMTNLDQTATYWKTEIYFTFGSRPSYTSAGNSPEQRGMFEVTLFDSSNIPLINFSMRDFYDKMEHNIPMWYKGNADLIWQDKGTFGSSPVKQQQAKVDSLDELPEDANILLEQKVRKQIVTIQKTCYIYKTKYAKSTNALARVSPGQTFEYISSGGGWIRLYTTSDKKTVGFLQAINGVVSKSEDEQILVTYTQPATMSSKGKWNDFTGAVVLERKKYGDGSQWTMRLYKRDSETDSAGKNSKTIYTHTETRYDADNNFTSGGALAKIGIFMGGYENSTAPMRMTLDDIAVRKLDETHEEEDTVQYIGNTGDLFLFDYGDGMVYRNGLPIMDNLDIGSNFEPIPAFTSEQIAVVSDAEIASADAEITERYL